MTQEVINIGAQADDGTGDTIRRAGIKINANFDELYLRPSVASDIDVIQNNISTTASNADIVIKPSGTGNVVFPGITIEDNNIKSTGANEDLKFVPSGSGSLVVGGIGFSGTSIIGTDSTIVNINENLVVDGSLNADTPTFSSPVTVNSTLDVASTTTLSTLTVSGASSFVGTTTIDNLLFNDNIISTSSNADLNLTPGGTGVVNVSNLTIDSSINLTDNVIKVTRSNDDFVLSANGTGSVQLSKIDMNEGTVDNVVIGGTTPAAGTFTTVAFSGTSIVADGVTITDNTIKANRSNDDLEFAASGTGKISINAVKLPSSDGASSQLLQTNGSGVISYFTSPVLFQHTDISDGTDTITGNSVAQTFDTFAHATYRSAKYTVQISDSTANRFAVMEVYVVHDGSDAYRTIIGGASNGTGDGSTVYDPLEFTARVDGSIVRVRAKVNNTNSHVLKFVRRIIKV